MSRISDIASFASRHRRLLGAVQLVLLAAFFVSLGWALRHELHSAAHDLDSANLVLFALGCAALVTSSMLLEAGLSAVSGVIVFVVGLPFVDDVHAPLVPLVIFGGVLAILVQPRVFRPLAHKVLRRIGYTKELPDLRARTLTALLLFYSGTWVLGGFALWLLLRSVGANPEAASIVFLGGTAAVGAIVAVLFLFAPSGLGPREASMYGLLLAVGTPGQALGAVALNRLALTAVELLLVLVGGLLLRGAARGAGEPAELPSL